MFRRSSLLAMAALALPVAAAAQEPAARKESGTPAMAAVAATSLKWTPAEIPGFVPGMEMAVVSGDPGKAEAYTMRLRFPSGYSFPGHWHPQAENLTVLSGTFFLGMGEKTNPEALKKYVAGDYLLLPGNMAHFGRVEGATVVQLHGVGPFGITVTEEVAGAKK